MSQSPKSSLRAILLVLSIITFYAAGSAIILKTATFDYLILKEITLKPFSQAYAPFLTWAATSYAAMAVSIVLALFALQSLWKLSPATRKAALICFCLLSGISIFLLVGSGNAVFEVFGNSLCSSEGFCNTEIMATPYTVVQYMKLVLNAIFQIAAIGLLCGFLFSIADSSGTHSDRQKQEIALFYCAAFLLSMIVLTDILFFEFISTILPEGSSLFTYQKGFVDFFAIISSATLAIALAAGLYLGLSSKSTFISNVADGQALSAIGKLISTANISRTLAIFAPVIVTLVTGFVEG